MSAELVDCSFDGVAVAVVDGIEARWPATASALAQACCVLVLVAGVAEMPRRKFTAYNAVGRLVWAAGFLTVGSFLGGVPIIAAHIELFVIALVALSLISSAGALVRHRLQRTRRTEVQKRAENLGTQTASVAR